MSQEKYLTEESTHFGYKKVPAKDKAKKVADVFHSVASKYDLMNDVMSLGVHRLWKRFAIDLAGVKQGQHVLDLAGGTGDLAGKFASLVGSEGKVVLADINRAMLEAGRNRLVDAGRVGNIEYAQVDAECLPFSDNVFDCITIAFGLRNVTFKDKALKSMYRVLKPGGRVLILEFSKPNLPGLGPVYDAYSFNILPRLGQLVAGDRNSYQYLVESIRMHPDQETLLSMMRAAGFEQCEYFNLTGGIVALHRGYKF
jgi:demethylmenaquinone methyltransferase/2-methoxy-6-polyprenyl-1,4-benzoquinol methylase